MWTPSRSNRKCEQISLIAVNRGYVAFGSVRPGAGARAVWISSLELRTNFLNKVWLAQKGRPYLSISKAPWKDSEAVSGVELVRVIFRLRTDDQISQDPDDLSLL